MQQRRPQEAAKLLKKALEIDPGELNNVIEQHPDVARELESELDRLVSAMKPRAAQAVALDSKARKRLQGLGYLSGGKAPAVADDQNRRDAKDMIDIVTTVMKARTVAKWGDHARVVAMVEPLTRRSPESDCLYEVLGPSYIAIGRYAEAEKAFKMSMRTMAGRVDLLSGLGVSYFRRGMLKDAIQVFEEALRADPDHAPTHNQLGTIYAQTGRFELAWKHFNRGLELEPDSPSALSNVANLHMQQRRPQEAAKLLTKALEIDPGCAIAHWGLWQAMRMSGISRGEVVGILRRCLQTRPDDPIVSYRLAWALATDSRASSENINEALRLAIGAAKTAPKNPEVVDTLAVCYAAARRFQEAVRAARQALALANAQRNAPLARQINARLQMYQSEQRYTE
jgi:Flp pilus assembly protein TadD